LLSALSSVNCLAATAAAKPAGAPPLPLLLLLLALCLSGVRLLDCAAACCTVKASFLLHLPHHCWVLQTAAANCWGLLGWAASAAEAATSIPKPAVSEHLNSLRGYIWYWITQSVTT
jgi:hypothetical protein